MLCSFLKILIGCSKISTNKWALKWASRKFTLEFCWPQRDSNSDCRIRRCACWPLDNCYGPPLDDSNYSRISNLYFSESQLLIQFRANNIQLNVNDCCSVGRADTSNTLGPRFKSSHRQNTYCTFTVNYIDKKLK